MEDTQPTELQEDDGCYVALTHDNLNVQSVMDRVRSPEAGAIVLFAGTTRNSFNSKPVKELQYSAYTPLALRTMLSICRSVRTKHSLKSIAMVHRLGVVPIGEESILIAVSAPHRQAAWRGGEEALEECKSKAEIWKREEFEGEEEGVWRANREVGSDGRDKGEEAEGNREGERRDEKGDGKSGAETRNFGPVIRPKRPGEKGHGPVYNPRLHQTR